MERYFAEEGEREDFYVVLIGIKIFSNSKNRNLFLRIMSLFTFFRFEGSSTEKTTPENPC
jgi:hypothetical protein